MDGESNSPSSRQVWFTPPTVVTHQKSGQRCVPVGPTILINNFSIISHHPNLKLVRNESSLWDLPLIHNLHEFEAVCKKITFFDINWEKLQLKFVLFCVQDQLGLKIKNWDHFRTFFNATNPMEALDLSNELWLKNAFF